MLVIQPKQLDTLATKSLVESVCHFLRKELPGHVKGIPGDMLKAKTASQLEIGKACFVKTERGLHRFVCLCVLLGDGFEKKPEYAPLFTPESPGSDANLDLLFNQLAEDEGQS